MTAELIKNYKNAFYGDTTKGGVLYIPDINKWFAGAEINKLGNKVELTKSPMFDIDPFSVMPELTLRLQCAIKAEGVMASPEEVLSVKIEPTEFKIVYELASGAAARRCHDFLFKLRAYVAEGIGVERRPQTAK